MHRQSAEGVLIQVDQVHKLLGVLADRFQIEGTWQAQALSALAYTQVIRKGEKIVIISATDQPIVHSQSLLTSEMLRKLGLNVELSSLASDDDDEEDSGSDDE